MRLGQFVLELPNAAASVNGFTEYLHEEFIAIGLADWNMQREIREYKRRGLRAFAQ